VNLRECTEAIRSMFNPATIVPGEFGVTGDWNTVINKIGYATNLTPETVALAAEYRVDLIVTHHDAWDFVFGMKEACLDMLTQSGIAHIFAHLPLDAAEFGTANALAHVLGAQVMGRCATYDGFQCGVLSSFEHPVEFFDFISHAESVCEEKVRFWRNNQQQVQRIGIVPGAGILTSYIKECVEHNCDLYLTGEKNLFTVQYAAQAGINLVVGSHTFTEVFGVEELVNRFVANHPEIKSVRLNESHIENAC
jgi:putative NIF3 family GTP cyclohydrolase 1 type 2